MWEVYLWGFPWAFSLTTETLCQSESSQSGPILPEETEAKVRTFTEEREGSGEGRELLTAVSQSGYPGR